MTHLASQFVDTVPRLPSQASQKGKGGTLSSKSDGRFRFLSLSHSRRADAVGLDDLKLMPRTPAGRVPCWVPTTRKVEKVLPTPDGAVYVYRTGLCSLSYRVALRHLPVGKSIAPHYDGCQQTALCCAALARPCLSPLPVHPVLVSCVGEGEGESRRGRDVDWHGAGLYRTVRWERRGAE